MKIKEPLMADRFDALRKAVADVLLPIGNMDPEGRAKLVTRHYAFQNAANADTIRALLEAHDQFVASEVEAARASPADTRSERERFEAWAHSMCMSVEREPFPTRQAYLSLATSNAWEGWKGCRASLPAPTDADVWFEEAVLQLRRVQDWSVMFGRGRCNAEEKNAPYTELLAHLRAHPAEPTPSVDVLRQCLEALESSVDNFPANTRHLAAIDAARQALEKP